MAEKIDTLDEEKEQKAPRSQTLVRGLDILDAVADRSRTIQEIAAITGLTYSTVHRIVSVLLERRFLKADNAREFGLGPRLIELGFSVGGVALIDLWARCCLPTKTSWADGHGDLAPCCVG